MRPLATGAGSSGAMAMMRRTKLARKAAESKYLHRRGAQDAAGFAEKDKQALSVLNSSAFLCALCASAVKTFFGSTGSP